MWLILIHASGGYDYACASKSLRMLQQKLAPDTSVYVVWFGPTYKSIAVVGRLSKINKTNSRPESLVEGWELLDWKKPSQNMDNLAILKSFVLRVPIKDITAVCILSHGSGWVFGPWKHRLPFLSLQQLNQIVLDRFKPELVCFDSCLAGGMSCLYSLGPYVRYCVASPSLHPYTCLFEMTAFAHSMVHRDSRLCALQMAGEWHQKAHNIAKDRCLLVFDVNKIKEIAPAIRSVWHELVFDRRAKLSPKEPTFDLWSAARNHPQLQKLIHSCVLNVRQALHECVPCKRVRGMSVELGTPKKWAHIYLANRWVRYLNDFPSAANAKHLPARHSYPKRNNHVGALLPPNLPYPKKKKK
jgi:hypothetical protein